MYKTNKYIAPKKNVITVLLHKLSVIIYAKNNAFCFMVILINKQQQ